MTRFRQRNFVEWLEIVGRRRYLFLSIVAILFGLGMAFIWLLPNVYESRASVAVLANSGDSYMNSGRATAVTQLLTSRPSLEAIIKKENLYHSPTTDAAMADATSNLQTAITIDTKTKGPDPELISIAMRSGNPEVARAVVADLVALFDASDSDAEVRAASDASALSHELTSINGQLIALNQRRNAAAVQGKDADRDRAAQDAARAQREAAASTVDELSDRAVVLQGQIDQQSKEIEEREKAVRVAARTPNDRTDPAYASLSVRKAEISAKLETLSTELTPKHPKVIELQGQLAEVERQMAVLEARANESGALAETPAAAELRALRRDQSKMIAELEITKREMDRKRSLAGTTAAGSPKGAAPTVVATDPSAPATAIDPDAEVEYSRLQERYNILLSKQLAAGGATAVVDTRLFRIVDPPSMPQKAVGPNRRTFGAIALVMAIFGGLFVVVALELKRLPIIYDPRDVDYYLGVPVLALIPEMVTNARGDEASRIGLARRIAGKTTAIASISALVGLIYSLFGR